MDKLSMDYETASKADLKKVGADVYSRHPSTKVLMLGYRFNAEPVQLWLPHRGPMPKRLREGFEDPEVMKTAFNAPFERAITQNTLGIPAPARQWRCVQVMAHSLGLPGKLETLVRDCLRLPKQYWKDAEGERLMRMFSFPNSRATHESHPVEFERYGQYCMQDVVAECKTYDVLVKYIVDIEKLFEIWVADQEINERGLPVDYTFIDRALEIAEKSKAKYGERMRELTGLANPGSTKQLLPWLRDRGYPFASIAKGRVQIAMSDFKDDIKPDATRLLKMRLESNKTSLKKFVAMRDASYAARLRNVYQFRGAAATGRYAGRILGQNMPRPWSGVDDENGRELAYARECILDGDLDWIEAVYGKPLEVLASSIRSAIAPKKGKKLVVADLSSIELVVSAWLCRSKFWLDVVDQGLDAYKAFGSKWYNIPYEQVSKDLRKLSKPAALGCFYRLGPGRKKGTYPDIEKTGLWGYAANMGVQMTQQQCKEAVKVFRGITPEVKNWWYESEQAAMEAVRSREPQTCGMIRFDTKPPFLRMRLPSGRYLHYCRPSLDMVPIEFEDEETGQIRIERLLNITYERTAKQSGKWTRTPTQGGKILENAVQAIALDILESGILLARKAGLNPIGHFHDEILCEVDESRTDALAELIACMTTVPKWAEGMTLRAAGYENDFYRKD